MRDDSSATPSRRVAVGEVGGVAGRAARLEGGRVEVGEEIGEGVAQHLLAADGDAIGAAAARGLVVVPDRIAGRRGRGRRGRGRRRAHLLAERLAETLVGVARARPRPRTRPRPRRRPRPASPRVGRRATRPRATGGSTTAPPRARRRARRAAIRSPRTRVLLPRRTRARARKAPPRAQPPPRTAARISVCGEAIST